MGWNSAIEAADRAAIAVLRDPGDVYTYTPGGGEAAPVDGIFDDSYLRAEAGRPGVTTSGPTFFARLSDFPRDPEEDAGAVLTVNGVAYKAAEVEKDGQGGVLLRLHEVA